MKQYEGVSYYPIVVRWTDDATGKRKQKTLYTPGRPWTREIVARWADDNAPDARGRNLRIGAA